MRAALVRREALARLARQWRLGSICSWGGARMRAGAPASSHACATFEAVIGALYLDQGLEVVRATLLPIIAQQLSCPARALHMDAKSRLLQEWSQSAFGAALLPRSGLGL